MTDLLATVEQLKAVAVMHEERIRELEAVIVKRRTRVMTDPPRTCAECGHEFTRRADEQRANFNKRVTCGPECRSKHQSRTSRAANAQVFVEPHPCSECGQLIPRGGFTPSQYARRVTCSKKCMSLRRSRLASELQARLRAERSSPEAERARRLKVERERLEAATRPAPRRLATPQAAWDAAARAVRDYRGLPLSADDVAELTGMSKERAKRTLELLTAGGVLAARLIEGNVSVWFDPHALSEAA